MEVKRIIDVPRNTESLQQPPYVISGDLEIVMRQWAERTGFTLPNSNFFMEMSRQLTEFMGGVFPAVEFISADQLRIGIQDRVARTGLPAISLDRVYYQGDIHLDVTRKKTDTPILDSNGDRKTLLIGRRDALPLREQIHILKGAGINQATVIDDVIFEGGVISKVVQFLERQGITIPTICAGVVVGEGEKTIKNLGKQLLAVRSYPEVIDEVCERDFYIGVPYSGRSIQTEANVGVPYILPFGRPNEWASIPEDKQVSFSQFCIEQSMKLYSAIERVSGKPVLCSDIERKVPNFPTNGIRAARALSDVRAHLSSLT